MSLFRNLVSQLQLVLTISYGAIATASLLVVGTLSAQVTVSVDFTDEAAQTQPIYDFWSVRNQLNPYPKPRSTPAPDRPTIANCIRLLGGWNKDSEAKKHDIAYWDGGDYAYRWDELKRRVHGVHDSGMQIQTIVLDKVPWDMQRDFKFVDKPNGKNYLEKDRLGVYGNPLPPSDPDEWADFIVGALEELIDEFGLEAVSQWRFKIATEADYYPQHWAGSKMDFFEHYRNTADAVLSVLPNAKIGTHFLGAGWKTKKLNHVGEPIGSYGPEFIRWAHKNKVKVDFVGISFYPFYTRSRMVDLDHFYKQDFEPFTNQREWPADARMEIHEYSLFTEVDRGHSINMSVGTSHRDAYEVMLARMVYENSIGQVQSWGDATNGPVRQALKTMLGKMRVAGEVSGDPSVKSNMVNGIFAMDEATQSFDVLLYNYNVDPEYKERERVTLDIKLPTASGTEYECRFAVYSQANNDQHLFTEQYPKAGRWESEGGWIKDYVWDGASNRTDKNGDFKRILVGEGRGVWMSKRGNLGESSGVQWSQWHRMTTEKGASSQHSMLKLPFNLASFSFVKFEFRPHSSTAP